MGSEKRERQKQGRQARLAEAQKAERRAAMRKRTITIVGVIAAVLVVAFLLSLRGGDGDDSATTTTEATAGPAIPPAPGEGASVTGETECPPTDGTAERTTSFENPPPNCLTEGVDYSAVFDTTEGEIRVDLDEAGMPETVNNFVTLARYGYYDDTAVFRTDDSIEIIQGGAPITNSAADPGPGYTITDEADGFTYEPGQLVMARSQGPDSSGAQFFFVAGPAASSLDAQGTYLVFGETDEAGLGVVQSILELGVTDPSGDPLASGPSRPVIVNSVTIEEN